VSALCGAPCQPGCVSQALANRIKTIERACGQHAVVKMRLFARVLCLEGYDELSGGLAVPSVRLWLRESH
jgi:hypothetical protein